MRRSSPQHSVGAAPARVAEYVRMSTDLQEHSIANQHAAIAAYGTTP